MYDHSFFIFVIPPFVKRKSHFPLPPDIVIVLVNPHPNIPLVIASTAHRYGESSRAFCASRNVQPAHSV